MGAGGSACVDGALSTDMARIAETAFQQALTRTFSAGIQFRRNGSQLGGQ
jgi:hypothetical protein